MNLELIVDIIEEYMVAAVELYNIRALKDQGVEGLGNKEVELSKKECELFNKFLHNTPKSNLWYELIVNIGELCRSNSFTGAWDRARLNMRKEFDNNEDLSNDVEWVKSFVNTERQSRKFVEQRAVYRTKIDEIFEKLVKLN